MAPFGINERLVRTSVFRLGARRLARGAQPRPDEPLPPDPRRRAPLRRRPPAHLRAPRPTTGRATVGAGAGRRPCRPRERARLRDELAWAGFGELGASVLLRPAATTGARCRRRSPRRAAAAQACDRARHATIPGARPLADCGAGGRGTSAALAADYRRFLQRFGAVIERFARATASTNPRSASSCARC